MTFMTDADRALLVAAKALPSCTYRNGYLLGLQRLVYGREKVSDDEHEGFMWAARLDDDKKRGADMERGYKDALDRLTPDPARRRGALSNGGRPVVLGPTSRAISARVSEEHYAEYQRRGGVHWLREQLSKPES